MAHPMPEEMSTYEAATKIAEMSPEAAGMMAACMEANTRHLDWVQAQVQGSLERQRDYWKERAEEAEYKLARIHMNILNLLDTSEIPERNP